MIEQFIHAAETLGPNTTENLGSFYSEDCVFTDPFQTVRGRQAVIEVYREMFTHLHEPRFRNVRVLGSPLATAQGQEIMVGWEFSFSLSAKKPRTTIEGCSQLHLNENLQIVRHFDYWDASALMQALPIIGPAVAFVRKKIGRNNKA